MFAFLTFNKNISLQCYTTFVEKIGNFKHVHVTLWAKSLNIDILICLFPNFAYM